MSLMLTKEQLEFIKTNTIVAVLIFSITANSWLVNYILTQNQETIKQQQEVLKDYRNNYILSKSVDDRSKELNKQPNQQTPGQ